MAQPLPGTNTGSLAHTSLRLRPKSLVLIQSFRTIHWLRNDTCGKGVLYMHQPVGCQDMRLCPHACLSSNSLRLLARHWQHWSKPRNLLAKAVGQSGAIVGTTQGQQVIGTEPAAFPARPRTRTQGPTCIKVSMPLQAWPTSQPFSVLKGKAYGSCITARSMPRYAGLPRCV